MNMKDVVSMLENLCLYQILLVNIYVIYHNYYTWLCSVVVITFGSENGLEIRITPVRLRARP